MILAGLFLVMGTALAQTRVGGIVVSAEDGEPVVGASVKAVRLNTGIATNGRGEFSLNVPVGTELEISYLGMVTKRVKASHNMRVTLELDHNELDEVMVVAYGTAKKSAFTGSAAVVDSKEIGKVQVTNAVDALKGKAAGVQINTASGQPGSTPTIRIRGVNSINAGNAPLIVLDGSPYDGGLNNINPADVESMTVLKDAASTALYGARGGNGVILITTKSAKRNTNGTITVDAKWGSNSKAVPEYETISSPAKYYEMYYLGLKNYAMNEQGMTDTQAWQWANNNMITDSTVGLQYNVYNVPSGQYLIGQNGKLNPNATLGNYVTYNGEQYYITPDNWIDETYSNSLRQEYTVSFNGGNDKGTFYGSANYLSNDGIVKGSSYDRFTARMKADYQIKPWLKAGGNFSYGHYMRHALGDDGSSTSSGNAFAFSNIAPIYPMYIRDSNGNTIYDEEAGIVRYDYGDITSIGLVRPFLSNSNPVSSNLLDKYYSEGNTLNGTGTAEISLPYDFTFTTINNVYLNEYRTTSTSNPYYGQYSNLNGSVYTSTTTVIGLTTSNSA